MRRLILGACVLALLMPVAASAAHFDVIPAGILTVNNQWGQNPLGPIYNPVTHNGNILDGCATIAVGSKVFDAGKTKYMRMTGVITDATGEIAGSWGGVWLCWGLNEMSWISGADGIYSDPQYTSEGGQPWSYKDGWIQSSNMVAYTGAVAGNYETNGFSLIMEDTRRGDVSSATEFLDIPKPTGWSGNIDQVGFEMKWDMTNYAPGSFSTLGSCTTTTWDPSKSPSATIQENYGPISVGIRHSQYPSSNPRYWDDYTDTVMSIAIVNDNSGTGSVSWSDMTLDVVGKLPGDANLDGVVDAKDASIVGANWLQSGMGWQQGDFGGGGPGAWGGLDGIVNDIDAAILAAHWGQTLEGAAVPEPSTLCLLVLGALALIGRKLVKR
jgi:hypothetical protein